MATREQCVDALHQLAARLAERPPAERPRGFDRSLSCSLTDLGVAYAGSLRDGLLKDITVTSTPGSAQVRLELTGDDLVALVDGRLNLGSAWAGGRIKVHAGIRDMMRLRSVF